MRHALRRIVKTITPLEYAAIVLLMGCCSFAAYFASKILALNPDSLISVYLFQHGPVLGDLLIADWHTNLLKFPLLWVQAHLLFTPLTFMLYNTLLLVSSIAGWAAAGALLCGRRYFAPVTIALSIAAGASTVLPGELAFTTIRNIEYPLYFLLLILFWRIVPHLQQKRLFTRRNVLLVGIYLAGMTLLIASDPFFAYISIPALVVCGGVRAWQQRLSWRTIGIGTAMISAPYFAAQVGVVALQRIGVFRYYGEELHPPFYALGEIPQSLWRSFGDFLVLIDGDIFGFKLSNPSLHNYVLCAVGIILIMGFCLACKKFPQYFKQQPALATLLLSTICLWGSYVLVSGLQHQYRYLVLALFTMVLAGTVQWYRPPASLRRQYAHIVVITVVALGMVGLCYRQYAHNNFYNVAGDTTALANISQSLKHQGINTVISGHTYSGLLKFWSGGELHAAPVLFCNQNLPFLTRLSWYKPTPQTSENVALIVDRQGRDAHSWACGNQALLDYYGQPIKVETMQGLGNTNVDVYTYSKDILSKVQRITTPGKPTPKLN